MLKFLITKILIKVVAFFLFMHLSACQTNSKMQSQIKIGDKLSEVKNEIKNIKNLSLEMFVETFGCVCPEFENLGKPTKCSGSCILIQGILKEFNRNSGYLIYFDKTKNYNESEPNDLFLEIHEIYLITDAKLYLQHGADSLKLKKLCTKCLTIKNNQIFYK